MELSTRSQNHTVIIDYSQKLMIAFQESCVRLGEENNFFFNWQVEKSSYMPQERNYNKRQIKFSRIKW